MNTKPITRKPLVIRLPIALLKELRETAAIDRLAAVREDRQALTVTAIVEAGARHELARLKKNRFGRRA